MYKIKSLYSTAREKKIIDQQNDFIIMYMKARKENNKIFNQINNLVTLVKDIDKYKDRKQIDEKLGNIRINISIINDGIFEKLFLDEFIDSFFYHISLQNKKRLLYLVNCVKEIQNKEN